MIDGIRRWREEHLGRKTIRRLYPVLIRRYGKGERYTAGQIERALTVSGLGKRYRPYAHAVFARPGEMSKLDPAIRRKIDPLTRENGMAAALQLYALAMLPALAEAAHGGDGGFFGGDTGGIDAGAAAGGGGDGGGA